MRLRARLALTLVVIAAPLAAVAIFLRADLVRRAAVLSLADFARARMESGGREQCENSPLVFQEPPLPPWLRAALEGRGPLGPDPLGAGPPGAGWPGAGPAGASPAGRGPLGPGPLVDRDRPPLDGAHPPRLTPEERAEFARTGVDPRPPDQQEPERRLGPSAPGRAGLELFAYGIDFVSANPRAPKFPAELRRELESGAPQASATGTQDARTTTTVALRMAWNAGPAAIVVAKRYDPRIGWGAFDDSWALALLVLALVGAVLVSMGPIVKRVRALEESVRRSAASRYSEPVLVQGNDEVAELAQAFNTAGADVRAQIDEIEKRERSLRDFVENTTHDVMLPLTVLQGHLSRMRNELAGGVMPSRDVVREALEESHYLASLVQNLGAAAKLEAGEPTLRNDPFPWNALIDRVVMRHKSIAREKGVELDFAVPEEDVISTGDVTLVEQAVSNVLHNAVRYNKAGGHVAILLEARDGSFTVRVFDDGPGVSEAELARLSERAYRSDAARARYPDGRGLGLAIAKDVAERHGFELTMKRAETGGLEVVFQGPCAANVSAKS